jgi:hypothetical protein
MKILFYSLITVLLFPAAGCSDHNSSVKPSPPVLTSFESRFGKEIRTQWEFTGQKIFMASFQLAGRPVNAFFEEKGKWLKTETELRSSELPAVIVKTVTGAFKGSSIHKSLQVDDPDNGITYRLSLKRGGKITEVGFTSGGVIISDPIVK